ncbi:glutaredoxin family protein [Arthrobacter sp. H14-L1]|uniref:glutaredoxin family protein n=1 Tax=Arthrobacter sp. H14-L1 TaxID=2996697 RepID=UPI00226F6C80|nr:glutaredoxin family protein [Arthrobacter sp. H14-L1]MCY0905799.1 glutaredoxin family protein [Arthrobacter sp. H14-L1]
MTITLYSKPGCFGCRKTAEKFTAQGVPFREVDLTTTPAALEYVTEELGYSQAPIVVVDDHFHWSGLRPDMIEEAIAAFHTQAITTATAGAGE